MPEPRGRGGGAGKSGFERVKGRMTSGTHDPLVEHTLSSFAM